MSHVIFIGTLVPDLTKEYCFSKGTKISAADEAMRYMIHGIETIDSVESIDSVGAVRIKAWPKSKILYLKSDSQSEKKGTSVGVGYINLPVIGFFLREKAIIREAKRWARGHRDKKDVTVLVYSMHSPFMKAANAVKKIIPTAKIVLTVADLPLFMDMNGSLRKKLKMKDWQRIMGLMPSVDKYLLYTKYMADYLKLPREKWMVFEGLIDDKKIVTSKQEKYSEKICLYAGNLDKRYGIDTLIEAFSKIKSNAKLYIYGAGFDAERINKLVENAGKVEYKGQVTPAEIFEIMKKSTLLINPRPAEIGLAKYSCPSKTLEYMASGTLALMNRLPGIPDEYLPYFTFFENETAESYAEKIDEVLSYSDEQMTEIGLKAAEFLKKEKNSAAVMKKVFDFIEG